MLHKSMLARFSLSVNFANQPIANDDSRRERNAKVYRVLRKMRAMQVIDMIKIVKRSVLAMMRPFVPKIPKKPDKYVMYGRGNCVSNPPSAV